MLSLEERIILADLIKPNTSKVRTKSALNPLTQNTTLCEVKKEQEAISIDLSGQLRAIKKHDPICYELAVIMLAGNLRVSEALNIGPTNYNVNQMFSIQSSKKGLAKVFRVSEVLPHCQIMRLVPCFPFSGYNRFYVYRLFKKCGFTFQSVGSSRLSVTHSIRHFAAMEARQLNTDNEAITAALGHKNANTQRHYGTAKKN